MDNNKWVMTKKENKEGQKRGQHFINLQTKKEGVVGVPH